MSDHYVDSLLQILLPDVNKTFSDQTKTTVPVNTVVSFRAEYFDDATNFLAALERSCQKGEEYQVRLERNHIVIAEPLVEIRSEQVSAERILTVLKSMDDMHVAEQTFREVPLEENSFQRDRTKGDY